MHAGAPLHAVPACGTSMLSSCPAAEGVCPADTQVTVDVLALEAWPDDDLRCKQTTALLQRNGLELCAEEMRQNPADARRAP